MSENEAMQGDEGYHLRCVGIIQKTANHIIRNNKQRGEMKNLIYPFF